MEKCTHTIETGGHWVDDPSHDPEEWACGGFDNGPIMWKEGYNESTTIDIGLHRYKCTQCNEIMYYSSAARDHYENGTIYPYIKGLGKEDEIQS